MNALINNHIQKNEIINGQQRHIDWFITVNDIEIITGYKSPAVPKTMFIHELNNNLSKSVSMEKIIIGDFNYDLYNEGGFLEKRLNKLHFKRAICTQESTTKFKCKKI